MEENQGQAPEITAPDDTGEGQDSTPKTFDEEYVRTLRSENAGYRKKLRDLEAKVSGFEQERMTETERLQTQAKAATEAAEAAKAELRKARVESEVAKSAAKLGIDYKLALKVAEVETDDDGNPVNVEATLTALLAEYPQLRPVASAAIANPSRERKLTVDDVKKMSPDEINRRWDEVKAAMGG